MFEEVDIDSESHDSSGEHDHTDENVDHNDEKIDYMDENTEDYVEDNLESLQATELPSDNKVDEVVTESAPELDRSLSRVSNASSHSKAREANFSQTIGSSHTTV